jgi:hypothetical protein
MRRKPTRLSAFVSGALSIAGALALKWSIVHAGHDSALDGAMNRYATRGDSHSAGWRPQTSVRTGVMPASRQAASPVRDRGLAKEMPRSRVT